MPIPSTFSNIKITNNSIKVGRGTPTTYSYSNSIFLNGNSTSTFNITGNDFSGTEASGNMMRITNSSANISNNQFRRGTTSLNSYISCTGTFDQNIVDNFFDGYTVNGSVEDLVIGLTSTSVYTRNKNQIEYIPIYLTDKYIQLTNGVNDVITTATGNAVIRDLSSYIRYEVTVNASINNLFIRLNLNDILPKGITLQQCKVGLFAINLGGAELGNSSPSDNDWRGFLISYPVSKQNYNAGTNSILDSENNFGTTNETVFFAYDPLLPFNDDILTTNAVFQTLTPITQSFFINNNSNMLVLRLQLSLRTSTIGSGLQARISPVVAKCIW